MSASSIHRAANDHDLINRVTALANKEVRSNEALADTVYGRNLIIGYSQISVLMWPVAVATEAAYETALLGQRGAPGFDTDIITDAAIIAAIVAGWPPDPVVVAP